MSESEVAPSWAGRVEESLLMEVVLLGAKDGVCVNLNFVCD